MLKTIIIIDNDDNKDTDYLRYQNPRDKSFGERLCFAFTAKPRRKENNKNASVPLPQ